MRRLDEQVSGGQVEELLSIYLRDRRGVCAAHIIGVSRPGTAAARVFFVSSKPCLIVGGTGRYAGVLGFVKLHARDSGKKYVFKFYARKG